MSRVFLIHGYSVWKTTAYGSLHKLLVKAGYQPVDIFLGRYVTLDDEVQIRDLGHAMHTALLEHLSPGGGDFHIITHSTGALIAKHWVSAHYDALPQGCQLRNLIFLAGPHFGSRLAHHGKSFISEVFHDGDPGREILTALELGSSYSWQINRSWAESNCYRDRGIRPYCIIGDKVRADLLRFVDVFREKGSDEVVRASAGNLNFQHFTFDFTKATPFNMVPDYSIVGIPFAVLKKYTHSGSEFSILDSLRSRAKIPDFGPGVSYADTPNLNLQLILSLLAVDSDAEYADQATKLLELTYGGVQDKPVTRFAQLQFRIWDQDRIPVNDFYVEFGEIKFQGDGAADFRPPKAIAHSHQNTVDKNIITFLIDTEQITAPAYQLRISADSGSPLVYFDPSTEEVLPTGEVRHRTRAMGNVSGSEVINNSGGFSILNPNMTTQIDVILDRRSSQWLFRFDNTLKANGLDGNNQPTSLDYHVGWDRKGRITRLPPKDQID